MANNPDIWEYLAIVLRSQGYSPEWVEDGGLASAIIEDKREQYSLVLIDLGIASETLERLRKSDPQLPMIAFPGSAASGGSTVTGLGPLQFVINSMSHQELNQAIREAIALSLETSLLAGPQERSKGSPKTKTPASRWGQKLDLFLKQVGSSDVPVLLQGETGAGKEVLARQLHACSPRAGKSFLKVNCAALPSELVESELFGYERGAFTGAFRSCPGKFEMADGGTILLDEIGDMDFKLQAKLLQVLQDGEFLRLGAKEMSRVNVRVIAATHCDLETAIVERRFREDLYYRLNVIRIEVPALRERRDEILTLAELFINKYSKPDEDPVEINSSLKQVLLAHNWPGNIRELENVIRKLVVLRKPDMVADELRSASRRQAVVRGSTHPDQSRFTPEPVSAPLFRRSAPDVLDDGLESDSATQHLDSAGDEPAGKPEEPSILRKVDEARKQAEIEAITSALSATLWNRKEAAALLNVEYKALLYKMKKLGIGDRVQASRA